MSDIWSAATSYRAALSFILQLADDPGFKYDEGILRAVHYMMMAHQPEASPGRWRRGAMSVRRDPSADFLFERDTSKDILYKCPDPEYLSALMAELVASLNEENDVPVIIRAAMAHLNLAAIHLFLDGNGRMARALQTLVLARQGISVPAFASIEEYLSVNHREYERVLREVDGGAWQPNRDARPWVGFCLTAHLRQASTLLQLTREYDRLWDELEREVTRRRLPERVSSALAEAAIGRRLRTPEYQSLVGVSAQVASRDLKRLVEAGLLVATNDKYGRCYLAADPVKAIRAQTRD